MSDYMDFKPKTHEIIIIITIKRIIKIKPNMHKSFEYLINTSTFTLYYNFYYPS